MNAAATAAVAALGLATGSFLNVVISRVPERRSIVAPGSACPRCQSPIRARDNVPVLSFVALGGRCRSCGERIPLRYPAVEVVTATLFVGILLTFHLTLVSGALAVGASGLVCLGAIDLERLLLPRVVVYATLAASGGLFLAASAVSGAWGRLGVAAACGAGWATLFLLIHARAPRMLGFGDVRLALLLGLLLGWFGIPVAVVGLFLANLAGLLAVGPLVVTRRRSADAPIPYGLFLSLGTVAALFFGPTLSTHGLW